MSISQDHSTSLTSKVAKSAVWVYLGKICGRIFELIKVIVLARLLTPDDFGLFGLVMLTIMTLDIFSQTGINTALIQQKEDTHSFLNTAWSIQVIRGFLLALILLLIAPLVGWFFKENRIVNLVQFLCLVPILQGFINIGVIYFEKEMQFHKQFLYEVCSSLLSLIVGIILAFKLRTVWALIWANLTLVFMRCILSYMVSAYRPRFKLIKSQVIELYSFGKWVSWYSIVLFSCQQLDKIFLGKILGPGALGLYQVAQRIADLPSSQIATSSISFTFPAYAKINHDKERLGTAFLNVFETITSLVLPLAVFIFVAAPEIVNNVLGEKWESAIIPLRILSCVGILTTFDIITTPIFMATGKPNIEFWKNLLRLSIIILTIYPLTVVWGIYGTCTSLLFASMGTLLFWFKVKSVVNINWKGVFSKFLTPLVLCFVTALSIIVSKNLLVEKGIKQLIISALCSLFFYVVIVFCLGKFFNKGIYLHIKRFYKGTWA